jgi:hypothetical protein
MSWEGRANVINDLMFIRAQVYYQVKHDIRPLQVEMVRFLQRTVDQAYKQAKEELNKEGLKVLLSPSEAIGNRVDVLVRNALKLEFETHGIKFGQGQNITINNKDVSSLDQSYRRPDARLEKVAFDWSLSAKTFSNAQIRGFFRADSAPDYVVIVRPSMLGGASVYLIPRPSGPIRKGDLWLETFVRWFRNPWEI